ncbi:MAG: glycoside hydrolase family 2 TIM barrel-domain containing protein [Draconibacterium sp.]
MTGTVLLIIIFLITGCNLMPIHENPRTELLLDFDWKFHSGDVEDARQIFFNDSTWRNIDLPHDWSIEDLPGSDSPFDSTAIWGISGGYMQGGTAWYRKTFETPQNAYKKKVSIYFEGVYMNSDVWLNGVHLGNHPYGYTAFEYDITDLLLQDAKNVLAVQVKNEGQNSRWYSGSGIYRHVWLKITDPIHIKTWGVFITTPEVNKDLATVKIQTQIQNETNNNRKLRINTKILLNGIEKTHKLTSVENIDSLSKKLVEQELKLIEPDLWSPENPVLYTAVVELKDEKGKVLDRTENLFGIRSIEFSVDKGFLLNGEPTLLKGGCVHHDNGPLGAAAYNRAEERRVEILKANGFNAIRCSHNPPSEAFLDACDKLGMLVIDESFDMWQISKRPEDYSNYFNDWWQKDIEAMVLRDRNHPSIIMWSIGNEIPERGKPQGVKTAKKLSDFIKTMDSTRPVTAAVNGLNPNKDPYFAQLDVAGYNYSHGGDHGMKDIFYFDHNRVPERIMYCAESYPLEAFGAWQDVLTHSYVIGDFVWTAFDYLGEASIGWRGYPHDENFYPWNHAFCGDIDICGFKRPQSYYRNILWNSEEQLSLFVYPPKPSFPLKENRADWSKWHWHDWVANWNWAGYENQKIYAVVCSGYESVELFLNGESLGAKSIHKENYFVETWPVNYQSGELKAVAYNSDTVVATAVLKTAQVPSKIELKADRTELNANGQDLSFITVELKDKDGVVHPSAENLVQFEINGPGKIVAVASSNPMSVASFQKPQRKAYKGRCMVIVKTERKAGEITLVARSEGLTESVVKLTSEKRSQTN